MNVGGLKGLALAIAALGLLGVAACATPSRPEAMAVPIASGFAVLPGQPGYHSVSRVTVTGGSSTNPLLFAQVSDADFKMALETSLAASGYMGPDVGSMSVSAILIEVRQPILGAVDLSVTSRVHYTAVRDGIVLFDETIAATGTGTFSDALIFAERMRIANEKSVQSNIRQFMTQLRSSLR